MSDLIERQAAIEALKRAEALTRAFGYHNVIETVREVPAVDAVPVVRCKDCKWCYHAYGDYTCQWFVKWMRPDDFCSRGERRTP